MALLNDAELNLDLITVLSWALANRMTGGSYIERFGVLTLKLRQTPCFIYDNPTLVAQFPSAVSDGIHVFISANLYRELVKAENESKGKHDAVLPFIMSVLTVDLSCTINNQDLVKGHNQAEMNTLGMSRFLNAFPEYSLAPILKKAFGLNRENQKDYAQKNLEDLKKESLSVDVNKSVYYTTTDSLIKVFNQLGKNDPLIQSAIQKLGWPELSTPSFSWEVENLVQLGQSINEKAMDRARERAGNDYPGSALIVKAPLLISTDPIVVLAQNQITTGKLNSVLFDQYYKGGYSASDLTFVQQYGEALTEASIMVLKDKTLTLEKVIENLSKGLVLLDALSLKTVLSTFANALAQESLGFSIPLNDRLVLTTEVKQIIVNGLSLNKMMTPELQAVAIDTLTHALDYTSPTILRYNRNKR